MKWNRRYVLLAVLVLAASAAAEDSATVPADGKLRLRFLSYNIHHGEGVDRIPTSRTEVRTDES